MHQPETLNDQRARLGLAIGNRAREVYERTIKLVYAKDQDPQPTEAYLAYREARTIVGTLLIARWLVCGVRAEKAELEWISQSGGIAAREGIPLLDTTRGFHV